MTLESLLDGILDGSLSDEKLQERMIRDEERRGFKVIRVGEEPLFLPSEDWHSLSFVSRNRRDIRLVGIIALNPGTGAFSRLVDKIIFSGMRPILVHPTYDSADIVQRWGWQHQVVGNGMSREDWFVPTKKWMQERGYEKKA